MLYAFNILFTFITGGEKKMDAKRARYYLGMTQAELAEAIGVSRQALCSFEKGKTKSPSIEAKIHQFVGDNDLIPAESYKKEISDIELRRIYADLKTALVVVKEAMDKVEVCL